MVKTKEQPSKMKNDYLKNIPIFAKIILASFLMGVLPLSIVSIIEIIQSRGIPRSQFNINAVMLCFGIFLSLMVGAMVSRLIIRPIRELKEAFDDMVNTNRKNKLEVKSEDELGDLAKAFNKMIDSLNGYEKKIEIQSKLAAVGSSTAMVAHDVRKPLTSMKALLSSLPAIKDDPEQLKKMIINVDRSISQTNTLLNDILEFSRDSTSLNLAETDPQGIIVSALSDALRNRKDAGVKISYNLKHSHVLHVDSNRVIRVLINIMDNAIDATELNHDKRSAGLLQISTNEIERGGKRLISISVADNGPGLSEEALTKIFDPFFTQGKIGGTGLGLAICHRIISMHGGRIEAANGQDGRGAVFTIELPPGEKRVEINEAEFIYSSNELKPFREEEAARVDYGDTANTSEFMRINKEKGRLSYLLIVDDEPLFRESIRCLLSELGQVKDHVKVVEADSAEKALTLFRSQEFDYVIADIDMGKMKMNGYEFSRVVLDQYPNIHVLIHSNKRKDEMDKNIRQIESRSFLGFLPKPMRSSELLQFLACKTFEVKPNTPAETKNKTSVLLVNDDEALRVALKWQIKAAGNTQVLEASSFSDAFSKIAGNNIDIILSDINLGDGEPNGYDLLKKVREDGNNITKFYMVSGYSKQSEEPNAFSLGADGYCQLPLEDGRLEEILTSLSSPRV